MIYEDSTLMPFGVHKDKRLIDVPEEYLVWLHGDGLKPGPLKTYIEENVLNEKRKTIIKNLQKHSPI